MASMRMKRPPPAQMPTPPGQPAGTFVRSPKSVRGFSYQWIDTEVVQPVHEQPRLVLNSAAQPLVRWGHRRIVRTHMRASMPLQGRWAFVGTLVNRFLQRAKISGVQSRGVTYSYSPWQTGAGAGRTVILRGPTVGR